MEQAMSEWRQVERLAHLQLLFASQPYFGRELRSFNDHPWWYRLEFRVPEDIEAGAALHFEGVDYFATVWLNGELLGTHEGYSDPFEFEVASLLRRSERNVLIVKVTSPWDTVVEPGLEKDRVFAVKRNMVKGTYEHADGFIQRDVNPIGIWRPVWLEFHGGVRPVEEVIIRTSLNPDGDGRVDASWTMSSSLEDREAELSLVVVDERDGRVVARTVESVDLRGGEGEVRASTTVADVNLWSTWDRGEPTLYRAMLRLTLDGEVCTEETVTFGFRSVELRRTVDETTFILNGKPLFIRGTSYFPDVYLSALDRARYERDVAAMVRAGMNAVRVHVHVQNPEFYDVCDRAGVVVLQDSDLNWTHPTDEAFAKRALQVIGGMVKRLRNHPSIMCWICMNEPWVGPETGTIGRPMMTISPGPQLVEEVRQLDPTRPVIKATGRPEDLDSGDSHTYTGSLSGAHTHFLDIFGTEEKLCTEFGVDVPPPPSRVRHVPEIAERLGSVLDKVDELHTYQYWLTKYYIEHYRIQKYAPCSGYVQFMWIDLCPQSFYGAYDFWGLPKVEGLGGALRAMEESNGPVGIFMEYESGPIALWAVNDRLDDSGLCCARWTVTTDGEVEVLSGEAEIAMGTDSRVRVGDLTFPVYPEKAYNIALSLYDSHGNLLARNAYRDPFHPVPHPEGHPHRLEQELGMRVFWA